MRISKAVEYGAAWAKEWTNEVSHVIVDKDIEYSELLKYLDTSSLPVCRESPPVSRNSYADAETGSGRECE